MRLIVFLSKLHRFAILALSLIICSVVGVVDAMSGPVYSMAPFYLAPVVIAAWLWGEKPAILYHV
jgi:hypothetical protein